MWPTEVQGAWAAALPAARHSAWHPPQRGKKRMLFLGYAWRDSYHRGRSMIFFDMGGGDTRFCVRFSCWCLRVLDPFTISRIFDNRRRRVVALRRRPSVQQQQQCVLHYSDDSIAIDSIDTGDSKFSCVAASKFRNCRRRATSSRARCLMHSVIAALKGILSSAARRPKSLWRRRRRQVKFPPVRTSPKPMLPKSALAV